MKFGLKTDSVLAYLRPTDIIEKNNFEKFLFLMDKIADFSEVCFDIGHWINEGDTFGRHNHPKLFLKDLIEAQSFEKVVL